MTHPVVRYVFAFGCMIGATCVTAVGQTTPTCTTKDLGSGLLFVRGTADCDATPQITYAVVSDYDSLSRFVSAIDSSHVVSRDTTAVVVRQIGTIGLLVQHRVRTVLRFEEHPPSLLRFEIEDGDFPTYYGAWSFEKHGAATRVVYSVTLKPPLFVPHWLVRPMLEQVLCKTMREVAAECARRSKEAMSRSK